MGEGRGSFFYARPHSYTMLNTVHRINVVLFIMNVYEFPALCLLRYWCFNSIFPWYFHSYFYNKRVKFKGCHLCSRDKCIGFSPDLLREREISAWDHQASDHFFRESNSNNRLPTGRIHSAESNDSPPIMISVI